MGAINLGPDLPIDSLLEAVKAHQPRLAWLACSVRDPAVEATAINDLADRLAERHVALALGGRGFTAMVPIQHTNVHLCQAMGELAAFARGLLV